MIFFFLLLHLIFNHSVFAKDSLHRANPKLRGSSALIINSSKNKLIFSHNPNIQIYPASLTKLATALYIIKYHSYILDEILFVKQRDLKTITPQEKRLSKYRNPPHWLETDGSTINLRDQERIHGKDLLYALLVSSSNDSANVLASACCDSVPLFVEKLNIFMKEIGCKNTHFVNPHGLHHPDHYTTSQDLGILACLALQEPLIKHILSSRSYTIPETNLEKPRKIFHSLLHLEPFMLGGKTGCTKEAGKNLIIFGEKNNREIIAILTGYHHPWSVLHEDMKTLCNWCFNEPLLRRYLLTPKSKFKYPISKFKTINLTLEHGVYYEFYPSEENGLVSYQFKKAPVSYPLQKGDIIGYWNFYDYKGQFVSSQALKAPYDINLTRFSKLYISLSKIRTLRYILILIICILLYKKMNRRKKRSQYFSIDSNRL